MDQLAALPDGLPAAAGLERVAPKPATAAIAGGPSGTARKAPPAAPERAGSGRPTPAVVAKGSPATLLQMPLHRTATHHAPARGTWRARPAATGGSYPRQHPPDR